MKNYCFCEIKNNVIWRNPDCPARFHTGTVFEYTKEDLEEMERINNRLGDLGTY